MLIPDNGINLSFSHHSMLPQEMISCGLSLGTHRHGISSTGLRQRVEHSRSNPPTMLHFIFPIQPWGSILFLTRIRVCGTRFGPLILPRKFKTSFGMLALTFSLPELIFDGGKYRQQDETTSHVLWECQFAQCIWSYVPGKIQKSNSIASCFHLLTRQMIGRFPRKSWKCGLWFPSPCRMLAISFILSKSKLTQLGFTVERWLSLRSISGTWQLSNLFSSDSSHVFFF